MAKAARAIIFENGKLLVMYRNKYGSEYYTLVGGRVQENESVQQALVREIREETGMEVVAATHVFTEEHPEPYNEQYIFYAEVAPHPEIAIQEDSEEGMMNRIDMNIHKPVWVSLKAFADLQFRTPQLHNAIIQALKKGFPTQPVKL